MEHASLNTDTSDPTVISGLTDLMGNPISDDGNPAVDGVAFGSDFCLPIAAMDVHVPSGPMTRHRAGELFVNISNDPA